MVTYSLMRIAHAPWCNRLKCTTTATKPPRMSSVVQAGGTPNFNDVNLSPPLPHLSLSLSLSPPEPLFAVVQTCNAARLQLHNSSIPNPSPAAGPWQDAVLLIWLMYEGFILCVFMFA